MADRRWAGLADPQRLRALDLTGLDAVPDESFDRFARLVRRTVGVPVALVSLVDPQRQFFPGADGLDEPWRAARQTPLSHSFCQVVVGTRERLVVTDARTDPRVRDSLAIAELGVLGYAGMPLVDGAGQVLGSLCAIDTQPREWSEQELSILADLAAACSAELQLRIAVARATRTDAQLTTLSQQVSHALTINELLLRASEAMARAETVEEVALAANHLGTGGTRPAFVGIGLISKDQNSIELVSVPSNFANLDAVRSTIPLLDDRPAGRCISLQAPIYLPDLPAVTADFPSMAPDMAAREWEALACVPLPGPAGPLGALVIAWAQPYPMGIIEQATLTSLAGYTANALQRVTYLRDTVGIAEKLQRAMLTDLPEALGVELVARYRAARATEQVGGDWYDAFVLPDGDTVLVIGDVAGHDMAAATVMGQLRSILRGYAVDRGESPAVLLRRLDHANRILGVQAVATAVVARVGAPDERGVRSVLWANAGHPPPVVLTADGRTHPLPGRDLLLGADAEATRRNYQTQLRPGDTLVLYTDGLVEDRRAAGADRTDELHAALSRHQAIPLPKLLDTVIDELSGQHRSDDVAVLAYRLDP